MDFLPLSHAGSFKQVIVKFGGKDNKNFPFSENLDHEIKYFLTDPPQPFEQTPQYYT